MEKLKNLLKFIYFNFAPTIVFYFVNQSYGLKFAIAISIVFVVFEIIHHKIKKISFTNLFKFSAVVTVIFGLFDLYLTNAIFINLEATVTNLITAGFFAITLFQPKSLIQEIAETQGQTSDSQSKEKTLFFKTVTAIWVLYFVAKAVIYLWINFNLSLNESLVARALIGNVSFAILLFASMKFSHPTWVFLKRKKIISITEN